jgi:pimeloyl-ACP methyl ester carboxylesterase
MKTVTSTDGTRIAFWSSGEGPPLLLVHGATADHTTTWRFVLPQLKRRFTVYAMDRRGRGASGDSPSYDLRREAEDIAAVVESIGEPVNLLGHSYGALCALEAARLTSGLRRLILYEGIPVRGRDYYPAGAIRHLEALLRKGALEQMLLSFFRDVVEMPPEDLALLRSNEEAWGVRVANVARLPRELAAEQAYEFDPKRYRGVPTPTLVLVGGESPARLREDGRAVAEGLPDARLATLDGQQHAAMYSDPELFVSEVVRFLEGRVRRHHDQEDDRNRSMGQDTLSP